jgi:hypothetical protein
MSIVSTVTRMLFHAPCVVSSVTNWTLLRKIYQVFYQQSEEFSVQGARSPVRNFHTLCLKLRHLSRNWIGEKLPESESRQSSYKLKSPPHGITALLCSRVSHLFILACWFLHFIFSRFGDDLMTVATLTGTADAYKE